MERMTAVANQNDVELSQTHKPIRGVFINR